MSRQVPLPRLPWQHKLDSIGKEEEKAISKLGGKEQEGGDVLMVRGRGG